MVSKISKNNENTFENYKFVRNTLKQNRTIILKYNNKNYNIEK